MVLINVHALTEDKDEKKEFLYVHLEDILSISKR